MVYAISENFCAFYFEIGYNVYLLVLKRITWIIAFPDLVKPPLNPLFLKEET